MSLRERVASPTHGPSREPLARSPSGRLAITRTFEPRTRSTLLTRYLIPLVELKSRPSVAEDARTRRPISSARLLTAPLGRANVGALFPVGTRPARWRLE